MTASDRFVCAVMGGVLGLILWAVAYLIVFMAAVKASMRAAAVAQAAGFIDPLDNLPAFSWGSVLIASFAIFGATVGAERMMNVFEMVVHFLGKVAEHVGSSEP